MKIRTPKYLVTDEERWLADRRKYVTSTEVSALLGLNRYKTGNQVRQDKKDGGQPLDPRFEQYIKMGHRWEEKVLQYGCELLGDKIDQGQGFYTIEADRISATPDAVLESGRVLEAKTTGIKNLRYWLESPPAEYLVQLQVQMMCTGAQEGYLTGLFFKNWPSDKAEPVHAVTYYVRRHEKLQKKILDKVKKFWDNYNETKRMVVPAYEKEETLKMVKQSGSMFKDEALQEFTPWDSITERDKQIIRQVMLELAAKPQVVFGHRAASGLAEVIKTADFLLESYAAAVNKWGEIHGDPGNKNVIIMLQSATKRAVELEPTEELPLRILQIAEYGAFGKIITHTFNEKGGE